MHSQFCTDADMRTRWAAINKSIGKGTKIKKSNDLVKLIRQQKKKKKK